MFQELVSPKTESGDPGGEKMAIHIPYGGRAGLLMRDYVKRESID